MSVWRTLKLRNCVNRRLNPKRPASNISSFIPVKLIPCVKVKVPHTRLESSLDLGTLEDGRWSASRPGRVTPGKDPVPIVQETGWASGPVWTCLKILASTGIRFLDRPARIPTELPDLYIYIYIYMELFVKPEVLSYIYGPRFGNAESRLFLFDAQCFNIESMQKVILWHICV
jgi:hypothetical protein